MAEREHDIVARQRPARSGQRQWLRMLYPLLIALLVVALGLSLLAGRNRSRGDQISFEARTLSQSFDTLALMLDERLNWAAEGKEAYPQGASDQLLMAVRASSQGIANAPLLMATEDEALAPLRETLQDLEAQLVAQDQLTSLATDDGARRRLASLRSLSTALSALLDDSARISLAPGRCWRIDGRQVEAMRQSIRAAIQRHPLAPAAE